MNRRNIIS